MASAQHELLFGSMTVVGADPSAAPYRIEMLANLDPGNPEAVVAPIQSQLVDGSLAEVLSYDNRNIVVTVEISGPTLDDVAAGSAALMVEVRKQRNTLTWTPPDEFAATPALKVPRTRIVHPAGIKI